MSGLHCTGPILALYWALALTILALYPPYTGPGPPTLGTPPCCTVLHGVSCSRGAEVPGRCRVGRGAQIRAIHVTTLSHAGP